MVLIVRVLFLLKVCSLSAVVVGSLTSRCGGSGVRELPTCVTRFFVPDLSRIGIDLETSTGATPLGRVVSCI